MADIGNVKKFVIRDTVSADNFHIKIPEYIHNKKILITNYEDLTKVIIDMMKSKVFFNIEKQRLREMMDDLTFLYNPGSDDNEARVHGLICDSDSDEDDESSDEENFRFKDVTGEGDGNNKKI